MIDVRELQRRGVVRIPKEEIKVPTTSDGFVEMESATTSQTTPSTSTTTNDSNANFFGFIDSPSSTSASQAETFATESDGYNKRQVDEKISDLDNKVYKLEQRLELLEKKVDVTQESSVGPMGW